MHVIVYFTAAVVAAAKAKPHANLCYTVPSAQHYRIPTQFNSEIPQRSWLRPEIFPDYLRHDNSVFSNYYPACPA